MYVNRSRLGLGAGVMLAALALCPISGSDARAAGPRDRFDTVVIDAGHGGPDHGARGKRGLVEKELVLDVAGRLASRLRQRGLVVVETRTDDSFVPLESRTSVANDARADLFISVHANSSASATPRGIETYFVSLEATDEISSEVARRENDALGSNTPASPRLDPLAAILGDMTVNEHVRESSGFATLAQQELARVDSVASRGIKQAPFVVLMGVRMPASLVEIGFLSNADDERMLLTDKRREAIAEALTRAVARFGADYDKRHGVTLAPDVATPRTFGAR
jgi:N-acetylmuramoyl-L-alanine amidase